MCISSGRVLHVCVGLFCYIVLNSFSVVDLLLCSCKSICMASYVTSFTMQVLMLHCMVVTSGNGPGHPI